MKIAFVCDYPTARLARNGGVESACEILSEELAERSNLEIHVVAFNQQAQVRIEHRNKITIHWLKHTKLVPRFLSYWNLSKWKIHKKLDQIAPQITHFHGLAGYTAGYSRPHIFTSHGIAEREVKYSGKPFVRLREALIKKVESQARYKNQNHIFISRTVANLINVPKSSNIWYISNPIDGRFFQTIRRFKQSHPIFLWVGRISRLKNIKGLLRAFAMTKQRLPGAELVLAGPTEDLSYFEECLTLSMELGIKESIEFVGNLGIDGLVEVLEKTTAFVLPSLQENAPLVLSEAMAASVPVIASKVGGIPGMIQNGHTGYLFEPDREHMLSEHMISLANDVETNINMGKNAKAYAEQCHHPKVVAQHTLKAYLKVLG